MVAVAWKVTATVDGLLSLPVPVPVPPLPRAPVWIAIALREGTVTEKDPPVTVNEKPPHVPEVLAPPIMSQYAPSGRDVEKVAVHNESPLLIATKPRGPEELNSVE